ncbi:MAG: hypothetical protein KAU95_02105, partial [Candidatus Aenigmarchaeota archaeon]|nr:hypothetical protein [Candidatus Aenigmarchaeota archaeon]
SKKIGKVSRSEKKVLQSRKIGCGATNERNVSQSEKEASQKRRNLLNSLCLIFSHAHLFTEFLYLIFLIG